MVASTSGGRTPEAVGLADAAELVGAGAIGDVVAAAVGLGLTTGCGRDDRLDRGRTDIVEVARARGAIVRRGFG